MGHTAVGVTCPWLNDAGEFVPQSPKVKRRKVNPRPTDVAAVAALHRMPDRLDRVQNPPPSRVQALEAQVEALKAQLAAAQADANFKP